MKIAKLPEPEFNTDGIFTVVFRRKYRIKNDTVNKTEHTKFVSFPSMNICICLYYMQYRFYPL